MTDVDNFLEHYGVKGMKWGVRRAASSIASGTSKATSSVRAGVKDAIQRSNEKRAVTRAERKANQDEARKRGYTSSMRNNDVSEFGIRATRRIEKRIVNGDRVGVARFKEAASTFAKGMAVGGAILATPFAIGAADQGLSKLASHINAKRGAEAARKLFADTKGLTSYSTVALSFNAAKGVWE